MDAAARLNRIRACRRKAAYLATESDRLGPEALIELGHLRALLGELEDDARREAGAVAGTGAAPSAADLLVRRAGFVR